MKLPNVGAWTSVVMRTDFRIVGRDGARRVGGQSETTIERRCEEIGQDADAEQRFGRREKQRLSVTVAAANGSRPT